MDEIFWLRGPDEIVLHLQPSIQGTMENERGAQIAELSQMAYSAKERGDLKFALEHEIRAYMLCLQLRDTLEEATFHALAAAKLYNMGQLYYRLEKFEEAGSSFEQAKELDAATGNLVGQAADIRSLGFLQQDAGNLLAALELHKEALELDSKAGFEYGVAIDRANIGSIYLELRDSQHALEYLGQALTAFEAWGQVGEAERVRQLTQIAKSQLA